MAVKLENVRCGWEFGMGRSEERAPFRRGRKPTLEKLTKEEAWAHACPVPEDVIREFGADWTLERYSSCDEVFGEIVRMASEIDFALYYRLTDYTPRVEGEYHDRKLKKKYIPKDFWKEMPPLTTPWGYALPRILIEQFGRGDENGPRTDKRVENGKLLIKEAIEESRTPIELVVKLSRKVCQADANPETVLAHLMAKGILKEEGCKTMFREISNMLQREAPELWEVYLKMLNEEKWQGQIIRPGDLK